MSPEGLLAGVLRLIKGLDRGTLQTVTVVKKTLVGKMLVDYLVLVLALARKTAGFRNSNIELAVIIQRDRTPAALPVRRFTALSLLILCGRFLTDLEVLGLLLKNMRRLAHLVD